MTEENPMKPITSQYSNLPKHFYDRQNSFASKFNHPSQFLSWWNECPQTPISYGHQTPFVLISLTIWGTVRKQRGSNQHFNSSNLFKKAHQKPFSKLLAKLHHIKIPHLLAKSHRPYPVLYRWLKKIQWNRSQANIQIHPSTFMIDKTLLLLNSIIRVNSYHDETNVPKRPYHMSTKPHLSSYPLQFEALWGSKEVPTNILIQVTFSKKRIRKHFQNFWQNYII